MAAPLQSTTMSGTENTPAPVAPSTAHLELVAQHIDDWEWRINHLYRITDKDGVEIDFQLNAAQLRFFRNMWYRNLILKARQLGFTTFMLIFMLDAAIFTPNTRCGLIAHTKEDAKRLFRDKLRYAYDKLPGWLRSWAKAKNDSAGELVFANGSSVTVGTSYRGGTLRYLHVSEFGKICRQYPHKAQEIVSGAFEAVGMGGVTTIESTAEGRQGHFFEFAQQAERDALAGIRLTRLDFRFFFYPWYDDPAYHVTEEEAEDVVIPRRLVDYFIELRKKHGIALTKAQMLWYTLKEKSLGAAMKQEYPTTPAEAFWQSVEGAYYKEQFDDIFKERRICRVPHQPGVLVHTIWDLGVNDANAIWFVQRSGREWHLIDYYENNDVGVSHYAKVLHERHTELGYDYGLHVGPHDLEVREWGNEGKTRRQAAREAGINFVVANKVGRMDGIEAVRTILPRCWFDEEQTGEGVAHLQAYRKEWDDKRGMWKDTPFHGPESNSADSFRYFAVSVDMIQERIAGSVPVDMQKPVSPGGYYA